MRAPWTGSRDESRLRRVALSPLVPAGLLYGGAAALHRRLYRSGILPTRQFAGHVVSVGNLLVGGTGKTPTAAWIAAGLHRRGRKVVLASRGAGRPSRERLVVVSDGRYVHARAERAGDEPMLLAAHAPGVPVLVGADRGLVGLRALSAFGADVLVLDDGFHHHRLERDLDVVTFDGGFGLGNGRPLPRGPLREPRTALRYADAIGVVDGPLDARDAATLERFASGAHRFEASRRPTSLRRLDGGGREALEALEGAEVGLLAGIARPDGFRRTIESLGARVVAERIFPDHHRFRPRHVRDLSRRAPLWITTEKDAIKLVPSWVGDADVRVLRIELSVSHPTDLLDWIESRLR